MDEMQRDTDAGAIAYIMTHPEEFLEDLTILLQVV